MRKDRHMRNDTRDTGRSLKQVLIWCWFAPHVFS